MERLGARFLVMGGLALLFAACEPGDNPVSPGYGVSDDPLKGEAVQARDAGGDSEGRVERVEELLRQGLDGAGMRSEEAGREAQRLSAWIVEEYREEREVREAIKVALGRAGVASEGADNEAARLAHEIHVTAWPPIDEAAGER